MAHHGGRYSGGHHRRRDYRDDAMSSDDPQRRAVTIASLVCVKCGSTNLAEARFCDRCGTPMSPATCASCSAALVY